MENNKKVRFIRVNGRVIPITESQHKKIEQGRKERKIKSQTKSNAYLGFAAGSMYGQVHTFKRNFNTSGSIKDKTFRAEVRKKPKPKNSYNWGPDKAIPKQQVRIGKAPKRMAFKINGGRGLLKSLAVAGAASGILGSISNKRRSESEKSFSGKGLAAGVGSAAAAGYVGLVHGVNTSLGSIAKAARSPTMAKYAARWATHGGTPLALASAGLGSLAYKSINKHKNRKVKHNEK